MESELLMAMLKLEMTTMPLMRRFPLRVDKPKVKQSFKLLMMMVGNLMKTFMLNYTTSARTRDLWAKILKRE